MSHGIRNLATVLVLVASFTGTSGATPEYEMWRSEAPLSLLNRSEENVVRSCYLRQSLQEPQKVIIDADPAIGYPFKDFDDGLMLSIALSDPHLDILGITVEFGNTSQNRAFAKAVEIVGVMARSDIPVYRGSARPGINENSDAARFMIEQVRKYPGEVRILSVGALTNIATALSMDPGIEYQIQELITVGGHVRSDDRRPALLDPYDLNYGSDPECARMVFQSIIPLTVVPIDLCRQFLLDWRTFRHATSGDRPIQRYLRNGSWSWFVVNGGSTVPWDVVGLAYLVHPGWFERSEVGIVFRVFPTQRPIVTLQVAEDAATTRAVLTAMGNQEVFWGWLNQAL